MTHLLALPELSGPQTAATNEDWTGAIAYWWDAAFTQPVPLDGIDFVMTVRSAATDPNVYFQGSTDNGSLSILPAALVPAVVNGGTGWAIGDTFLAAGGSPIVAASYKVTQASGGIASAVQLVSAGSYSVLPANPVSSAYPSGTGAGLTMNLTPVNNAICVTISSASFPDTLPPGSYVYEIRGSDGVNTAVLVSGTLTITQGIVLS